jgi:hypothetical protein
VHVVKDLKVVYRWQLQWVTLATPTHSFTTTTVFQTTISGEVKDTSNT